MPGVDERTAGGNRLSRGEPEIRAGRELLGQTRTRRTAVLLRRAHRCGAPRTARGVAQRSVLARHPRRCAVRPGRRRHEERPRRDGDRLRGIRRPVSRSSRQHRVSDHQRRGGTVDRRDSPRGRGAARPQRDHRLVPGRRAVERKPARRHHQDRPPGEPERAAHGARRAGAHRVSAIRRQSDSRRGARARRAGLANLGSRQ